jgi:hypothetical protein
LNEPSARLTAAAKLPQSYGFFGAPFIMSLRFMFGMPGFVNEIS